MLKTKDIKQEVFIRANAHDIYEALMDSKKHTEFTGDQAVISRKVGGSFSTFSRYATGKNLELVPDKKIVQTWRNNDWPKDHYSTLTFLLRPAKDGTRIILRQKNVPTFDAENISGGWKTYYWQPLKKMLEK